MSPGPPGVGAAVSGGPGPQAGALPEVPPALPGSLLPPHPSPNLSQEKKGGKGQRKRFSSPLSENEILKITKRRCSARRGLRGEPGLWGAYPPLLLGGCPARGPQPVPTPRSAWPPRSALPSVQWGVRGGGRAAEKGGGRGDGGGGDAGVGTPGCRRPPVPRCPSLDSLLSRCPAPPGGCSSPGAELAATTGCL